MAVNQTRSLNADLQKGVNDGLLKSLSPDRGGEVETKQLVERAATLQPQYNVTDVTYHIGDPEEDGFGYA
jgi:hypothetical protein